MGGQRPNFCNVSNIFRHFCQEKYSKDFETCSSLTEYEHILATSLFEHLLIIIIKDKTTNTTSSKSETTLAKHSTTIAIAPSSSQTALNPKNVEVGTHDGTGTGSNSQLKIEPLDPFEMARDSEIKVTNASASAPETQMEVMDMDDGSKMDRPLPDTDDVKCLEFAVGGDLPTPLDHIPNDNANNKKDVQKEICAEGNNGSDSDDFSKDQFASPLLIHWEKLAKVISMKIKAQPSDKSLNKNQYKNYLGKQIDKEYKRLENEDRARRGLPFRKRGARGKRTT